jgi:hypothetical protein
MANATAPRPDAYRPSGGPILEFAVQEDEVIVFGGMVSVAADGYLKNASDTSGEIFCGVAVETVTGGSTAGTVSCKVDIGGALVKATHEDGSMSVANIGDAVVAELNNEVTSAGTGTNDIAVGVVANAISATEVWVRCRPFGVIS